MKKLQKGFTLIELMIVIAIIAIIAAIAIPNLLASRIQANETNAIAALKAYATAQVTFQRGKFGAVEGNLNDLAGVDGTNAGGSYFTPAFPLLKWGLAHSGANPRNLDLINDAFAAASYSGRVIGTGTAITPGTPYQGYLFSEDLGMTDDDWSFRFSLVGYTSAYSSSGYNNFWIGSEATVMQNNPSIASGTRPAEYVAGTTPLNGALNTWIVSN